MERRRFHPSARSAGVAQVRRNSGPLAAFAPASAAIVQEASALLRQGRFDPVPAQERGWDDFQTRQQYYNQRRHSILAAHNLERAAVAEVPPFSCFPPPNVYQHGSDWQHEFSEFLRGQPTDFSQLENAPEIRGLYVCGNPEASSGKAPPEHSAYLHHFDPQRGPRSRYQQQDAVPEYARPSSRSAADSRRSDTTGITGTNPLLQLWWGQYAQNAGMHDEHGEHGFSQSEWPAAGRWAASHGGREDVDTALQRTGVRSLQGNPDMLNLRRHLVGKAAAFSDLEEALSPSFAEKYFGGSAPPKPEKISEEELSSSTHVEGYPNAKVTRAKASKPKRASQLRPSKDVGAADDSVFICYICHRKTDAAHMKRYMRNRKVCDTCRNAEFCVKNDRKVKYCQLCSWVHPVEEFDAGRRSCKAELKRHNERRKNAKKQVAEV
eukprot:jgi/Tetstr1/424945/TSEL_015438.t1